MEGDKMKRILSTALAIFLALILISCTQNSNSSLSTGTGGATDGFEKPEQYTSVLLITINPQFRLYLDENGTVLAVEAVNKDAESLIDSIPFENESFETVIETIVTEANKSGFVKADATIELEIEESKETDKAQADILDRAEQKTLDVADELQLTVQVSVSEVQPTDDPNATDHVHSFSEATCTEPGKCDCGATEGTALGHDYKDGVCTRCGEKDPDYRMTSILEKQGKWKLKYLHEGELCSAGITVCTPGEYSAGVGFGTLLSKMPEEMQNDPGIKDFCETFNGEDYYVGMGSGGAIVSVTEENGTVTLIDEFGNQLVLARTGENTLKCVSAPDSFADIPEIPVDAEFTFIAD